MPSNNDPFIPPPYPVRVHTYLPAFPSSFTPSPPVQVYEHLPDHPPPPSPAPFSTQPERNALVFIGGLGDGPHSIPYVRALATHLSSTAPVAVSSTTRVGSYPWTVFEARLSSAYTAFGYGSLAQDARDLAALVQYLRVGWGARRVVLMGHSTGCQDCLEYGTKLGAALAGGGSGGGGGGGGGEMGKGEEEELEEGVRVDGFVLQGPVSDREAIGMGEDAGEVEAALRVARQMVDEGRGGEVMGGEKLPRGWRGTPVTAYRWCSLAGVGGDDDYFSSDLPDEKVASIWGKLDSPVLMVPSEKDEWVPSKIDAMGLVNRWKSFCKPGIASDLSGLIPGANHRVDNAEGQQWLAVRVARFLAELQG